MTSLSSLAGQWRREALSRGLPCSAPDVPWEPVYKNPVESPDDIIGVCVPSTKTLSGVEIVYVTRQHYEDNR
jgi:hypothetical protein